VSAFRADQQCWVLLITLTAKATPCDRCCSALEMSLAPGHLLWYLRTTEAEVRSCVTVSDRAITYNLPEIGPTSTIKFPET
jgi:hypothetical protein